MVTSILVLFSNHSLDGSREECFLVTFTLVFFSKCTLDDSREKAPDGLHLGVISKMYIIWQHVIYFYSDLHSGVITKMHT